MSDAPVFEIVPIDIRRAEPPEYPLGPFFPRADQKMDMISHQTIRVQIKARYVPEPFQQADKGFAVLVIEEDLLAVDPPQYHMIYPRLALLSRGSCHNHHPFQRVSYADAFVKTENRPLSWSPVLPKGGTAMKLKDKKIDIQETKYVTDKYGNREKQTVTIATVWAYIRQLSGFQGIKFPWKPTLSGSIEYHGPPRSGRLSFRSPRLIPEF